MFITVILKITRWLLMYLCVCVGTLFIGSLIATIRKEYEEEALIYSYVLSIILLTNTIVYIIKNML